MEEISWSMNVREFRGAFEAAFPPRVRERPTPLYSLGLRFKKLHLEYYLFDPLRDVDGMISVKKQRLLKLAYAQLPPEEAYLEVGTWAGKSLIAAMHQNRLRPTYACDNFSEFKRSRGQLIDREQTLLGNLRRYGLDRHVTFYNRSFQEIFNPEHLPVPIGFYFYDARHDLQSQYLGIRLAEPFLSNEALVLVDDWRCASDSWSRAQAGTEKAMTESAHEWNLLYQLPARYNGDRAMWWNGIAVLSFRRR
jgi:hypothetical protein